MSLEQAKHNVPCIIKQVNIEDYNTKLRILELGLVKGEKVVVKSKSVLKHTLLVVFANACFTLKDNLAKQIEVEYA